MPNTCTDFGVELLIAQTVLHVMLCQSSSSYGSVSLSVTDLSQVGVLSIRLDRSSCVFGVEPGVCVKAIPHSIKSKCKYLQKVG